MQVDLSSLSTRLAVDEEKAVIWRQALNDLLEQGLCDTGTAAKMAARLSFAVTVAADKVGRAYSKPYFAQANDSLPVCVASSRMLSSAHWWLSYLGSRPWAVRSLTEVRRTVKTWQDAAGVSRWIAAVALVDDVWLWTRLRVPDDLWGQLLPRGDHQIGWQELLAVMLALETFAGHLCGSLWLSFVDNEGSLGGLVKGSTGHPETNAHCG